MTLRVLQGFIDTGGQANRYAQALRMQGYKAEAWLYERPIKSESYGRILNFTSDGLLRGRVRKAGYFLAALRSFDIWHIHKGFSLFHNSLDLRWAKRLGKSIIIHYRGREIRPDMTMSKLPARIIEKVRREGEIADLIFVKDGQIADLIAPYVKQAIVFPNIADVSDFSPPLNCPVDYFDSARKLRVVHIPSNPLYKGTGYIRAHLKRLADKVDYREVSGVSHSTLLEEYWKADLVIDQLLTGTYGNSGLEAMALGRCVINYLRPSFMAYEPAEPPIINADTHNLADIIDELCIHRETIWAKAEDGKRFVNQYHSFDSVGRILASQYKNIRWGRSIANG